MNGENTKHLKNLLMIKIYQRVLNSVLHSYHDTDKPVIIDKSRGWTSVLEMVEFALNRKAKVIVPVREITQIVASMEKMHRKNAHKKSDPGDYMEAQTVEGRGNHYLNKEGVIGLAYNRLKDAIQRGFGDRLYLVEFENLTREPEQTMAGIWQFLEMEPVKHNFDKIEQVTFEDDSVHLMDGLHTIKNKVRPVLDDSLDILGREYYNTLKGAEFWRDVIEV